MGGKRVQVDGNMGIVVEPPLEGAENCKVLFHDGRTRSIALKHIMLLNEDSEETSGSVTGDLSAESKNAQGNALLQNQMAIKAGNLLAASGSMDEAPAGTPARPGGVLHRLKRFKEVEESQKKRSRDLEAKREIGFRTHGEGNDRSIDEV